SAPTVTSLTASSGPTGGGNTVTITGTGLAAVSQVVFGSTTADGWTINSDTQIIATVPPAAAGALYVRVISPFVTSTTVTASQYTHTATAPAVTALDVSEGPTAGGIVVRITGTNFYGATAVSFGGTSATSFSVLSSTAIEAVAPALSTGTVD